MFMLMCFVVQKDKKTKNVPFALINLNQILKVKTPKIFGNVFSNLPPAEVEAEAIKLGGDKKSFFFKVTCNKWEKAEMVRGERVFKTQPKEKIRFI